MGGWVGRKRFKHASFQCARGYLRIHSCDKSFAGMDKSMVIFEKHGISTQISMQDISVIPGSFVMNEVSYERAGNVLFRNGIIFVK